MLNMFVLLVTCLRIFKEANHFTSNHFIECENLYVSSNHPPANVDNYNSNTVLNTFSVIISVVSINRYCFTICDEIKTQSDPVILPLKNHKESREAWCIVRRYGVL